jgi:hypothetical protein
MIEEVQLLRPEQRDVLDVALHAGAVDVLAIVGRDQGFDLPIDARRDMGRGNPLGPVAPAALALAAFGVEIEPVVHVHVPRPVDRLRRVAMDVGEEAFGYPAHARDRCPDAPVDDHEVVDLERDSAADRMLVHGIAVVDQIDAV